MIKFNPNTILGTFQISRKITKNLVTLFQISKEYSNNFKFSQMFPSWEGGRHLLFSHLQPSTAMLLGYFCH